MRMIRQMFVVWMLIALALTGATAVGRSTPTNVLYGRGRNAYLDARLGILALGERIEIDSNRRVYSSPDGRHTFVTRHGRYHTTMTLTDHTANTTKNIPIGGMVGRLRFVHWRSGALHLLTRISNEYYAYTVDLSAPVPYPQYRLMMTLPAIEGGHLSISRNGSRMALLLPTSEIMFISLDDGEVISRQPVDTTVHRIGWLGDESILYVAQDCLYQLTLTASEPNLLNCPNDVTYGERWAYLSPNRKWLAWRYIGTQSEWTVQIIELATGETETYRLAVHGSPPDGAGLDSRGWSSDSRYFFVSVFSGAGLGGSQLIDVESRMMRQFSINNSGGGVVWVAPEDIPPLLGPPTWVLHRRGELP